MIVLFALLASCVPGTQGFLPGGSLGLRTLVGTGAAIGGQDVSSLGRAGRGVGGLLGMASADKAGSQPKIGRREAMAGIAGVLVLGQAAAAGAEVVGPPPSFFSQAQGGVQGTISPGNWLGQFLGINSHKEVWEFDASPEEVSLAMAAAIRDISPKQRKSLLFERLEIVDTTPSHLRVNTWTKSEWLDVLDISFAPLPETSGQTRRGGGCAATVKLYATGFLPTSIPLAPVLNVLFFWFPFASPSPRGGMLQNSRSQELYEMLRAKLPKAGQSVK